MTNLLFLFSPIRAFRRAMPGYLGLMLFGCALLYCSVVLLGMDSSFVGDEYFTVTCKVRRQQLFLFNNLKNSFSDISEVRRWNIIIKDEMVILAISLHVVIISNFIIVMNKGALNENCLSKFKQTNVSKITFFLSYSFKPNKQVSTF